MLKPLIKISISSIFSNLFDNRKSKKTGIAKKILFAALGLYLIFAVFSMSSSFFLSVGSVFVREDNLWVYFAFAAILVTLISLIGSFGIAQSLIYNSKDNDLLLSMPIKISDILLSRIFVLLIFNYVYSALVFIPAGVVHEYFSDFSAFGLISFIVLSLLLPLITTSISIVFAWILTLTTKRMKNKSIFTFVFALAFLLGYMYFSFNLQNAINFLTFNYQEVAVVINKYLTLFYLYGSAVANGNILNFIVFAAVAVCVFSIAIKLLSSSFLKMISNENKRAKTVGNLNTKQCSSLFTLMKKEYERLISFPTYILNTTLGGILAVIFSVMILIRGESLFINFTLLPGADNIIPLVIATVLAFCAGMNSTTVSSISLEGNTINIIKSLPITHRDFYNSRILLNLLYGIPITLIASVVSCFALDGDLIDKLIVTVYPLALQLFAAVAGLSINMHKPKFDWTNPVYPVKQSFNVLFEIIYSMVLSVVPLAICIVLGDVVNYRIISVVFAVIVLIIDLAIYIHIISSGKKYFEMMS